MQNPYASPNTIEAVPARRQRPVYRSRGHALLAGLWRGAKFGGGWMAAIAGGLALLLWGAMLTFGLYRWVVEGVELWRLLEVVDLLEGILGTVGAIAVFSLYAAVLGALIMGTAAIVTYRKPGREAPEEPAGSRSIGNDKSKEGGWTD